MFMSGHYRQLLDWRPLEAVPFLQDDDLFTEPALCELQVFWVLALCEPPVLAEPPTLLPQLEALFMPGLAVFTARLGVDFAGAAVFFTVFFGAAVLVVEALRGLAVLVDVLVVFEVFLIVAICVITTFREYYCQAE